MKKMATGFLLVVFLFCCGSKFLLYHYKLLAEGPGVAREKKCLKSLNKKISNLAYNLSVQIKSISPAVWPAIDNIYI